MVIAMSLLQSVHYRPDIVQRMLVGRSRFTLMIGNFRFEVVVVRLFRQSRKHLNPCGLRHEQTKGVVGPSSLLNVALAKQVGETLLECLQMRTQPSPNHDAVRINGLAVTAVSLAGADGTEEAVLGENPYLLPFANLNGPIYTYLDCLPNELSLLQSTGQTSPHSLGTLCSTSRNEDDVPDLVVAAVQTIEDDKIDRVGDDLCSGPQFLDHHRSEEILSGRAQME